MIFFFFLMNLDFGHKMKLKEKIWFQKYLFYSSYWLKFSYQTNI